MASFVASPIDAGFGSIVRCRNRDWVLLPSDDPDVHHLRPLTGMGDDLVAVHRRLADLVGAELPGERVCPATFPLPSPADLSDAVGAHLLWQAARLTLREGAAPFRSLGRISIRPRSYQFVPLLMALRLDPVRLLIADDVGVGKTIEALLIARELLDRREIGRLCVVCPPSLCEQWQRELAEKFNLEAVVVRSGTVGPLERRKPISESLYRHYPYQVASIDFLKTDRNRHAFVQDCPELVIVDEAHGAARASESGRQQRHDLVRQIAARRGQHLILLTATPHSGIEQAFRSLLALLRPAFGEWDTSSLDEPRRIELARHYVQRTRRDLESQWEGGRCFPTRESSDETYSLSRAYGDLFSRTYDFCEEIVATGERLDERRRRVRYWGALALLGCVMSSPAAALAALAARRGEPVFDPEAVDHARIVEPSDDRVDDDPPAGPISSAVSALDAAGQRQLRDIERRAEALLHAPDDRKLAGCAALVAGLLRAGHHPIVWCRYVATADYVAEGLRRALQLHHADLRVVSITGRLGDDERRAKVRELAGEPRRVLVATDCLSEGINLQDGFSAVVHYDLPWNPNRLEQREGRVDRYGQSAPVVRAVRYFCPESPVDGVVLDVLLNKAREIHKVLGTHVPVPDDGETVTQALLNALFLRRAARDEAVQLTFDLGGADEQVAALHRRWDRDVERERVNRTRFAQRAIKPEVVQRELEAADEVLGDPDAVRRFALDAGQRLRLGITADGRSDVFRVPTDTVSRDSVPPPVRFAMPSTAGPAWRISFTSPTPAGAEYLGRNHPFVAALARFLMEEALEKGSAATAVRCGVVRTRAVPELRTILLLRVRYLLKQPERPTSLSEEVWVRGAVWVRRGSEPEWLPDAEALRLLTAEPEANVPLTEKQELIAAGIGTWPTLRDGLRAPLAARADALRQSHARVRRAAGRRVRELSVVPQHPPDLLGMLILQPMV